MWTNGERMTDVQFGMLEGGQRHRRGSLAGGEEVHGARERGGRVRGGEGATDGAAGADPIDRRARNRQQVGAGRRSYGGQLVLFGSDHADNRVTTSNSRSSLAMTWSASAFADNEST